LPGKNSHANPSTGPDFTTALAAFLPACFFILLSTGIIPYPGIQDDEALFATPLYEGVGPGMNVTLFHQPIPLVMISYLGTLKTLIYWPLLHWIGSGVWVVRLPMALAGALTILLFYFLVWESGNTGLAPLIAALLLATDPIFLLTNTFDWGPVALQHLLTVAGCLLLLRFGTRPSQRWHLAGGFFLFGVAFWNKALFVWTLVALTVSVVTVFRREFAAFLTRGNCGVAATAFVLGSFPLVIYNFQSHITTLGENTHIDTEHLPQKWLQLKNAANGSALFGFIAEEEWRGPAKSVRSFRGRAALWIREHFGEHRESGFFYSFSALLLAVPLWWRVRAARFCLVFIAVAWILMALTRDAGGATHHVVLLWPFPMFFAALAIARLPRILAMLAGTALLAMNLLVVNQYQLQLERDGGAGNFTDALFTLSSTLAASPQRTSYILDWGMQYSLELMHRGALHLSSATDPLSTSQPNEPQRRALTAMLATPGAVFVNHVPEREVFKEAGSRMDRFAGAAGYRREPLRTIYDSNGRPVFEIFHYVR
jgi:hypothetical protein